MFRCSNFNASFPRVPVLFDAWSVPANVQQLENFPAAAQFREYSQNQIAIYLSEHLLHNDVLVNPLLVLQVIHAKLRRLSAALLCPDTHRADWFEWRAS